MRGILLACLCGCGIGDGADVTRNRPGGDPSQHPMLPDGGGDLADASPDLSTAFDLASAPDLAGAPDLRTTGGGVTLAIFGRSFNTSASGSFNWQTFAGTGETAGDFVSNVVPYQWYAADLAGAVGAGDNMVLVRVKAGPSSGSLIVDRIEICLDA